MILTGTFIVFDKENTNGRIYTKELIDNFISKCSENKKLYGELDYNCDNDHAGIEVMRISHEVKSIYYNKEKNSLDCDLEIMDNSQGKLVKCLVDANIPIYAMSKAFGTQCDFKNKYIEKDEFNFITINIINKPNSYNEPLKIKEV